MFQEGMMDSIIIIIIIIIIHSSGAIHFPTALPRDKIICYTFYSIFSATAPLRALPSFRRRLHFSLSYAHFYHPRIPEICDVSLRTTSSHLVLGFPTGLV